MKSYNLAFRKKDYPTDVLSFPVNEVTAEGSHCLGDILISVEKAWKQAQSAGHSLDRELEILLLHGVLHLLGFDHETDSGEMDTLEQSLRIKLLDRKSLAAPAGSAAQV
jgi:probable rRNA maturation factor